MSDDPFAPAAAAGIHRLSLPTPFAVGRVNCYLIDDEPLTLVDTGPNSGTSLEELSAQLGVLGRRIEDIELILATHQHMDHIGLVGIVARRSGAEVAMLDLLVPVLEDHRAHADAEDEFATALMLRHGLPEDVVQALQSVSRAYRAWGGPAKVTRVLRDGDVVELRGRALRVCHRPGHTPSDTVFHDPERRLLIAGDHLIGHISSNPLIARLPGGATDPTARQQSLVAYLASLERTREMDVDLILPGHGDPVTDHRSLIDARIALHRRRAEKIFRLIGERPRSAYELAQTLWGNVAVTQAFLTLSEVLGHTDILINEGRVREVVEGGVAHFEAVA